VVDFVVVDVDSGVALVVLVVVVELLVRIPPLGLILTTVT